MRPLEVEDVYRLRTVADPRIAPDGSRVAFVVRTADAADDRNVSSIRTVDMAGAVAQLTRGPSDARPRWSPEGTALGFLRDGQVWTMSVAGGDPRALTADGEQVSEFEWSPDGTRIAYTALAGEPPADADPVVVTRLRYKADGTGLRRRRRHLFVRDLRAREPRQLTSGDHDVAFPAWSPDGSRIAFSAAVHPTADVDWISHVFTVGADGGEPVQVTRWSGSASGPVWSPDGTRIAFVGSSEPHGVRPTRLWTVDAAGGEPIDAFGELDRTILIGMPGYPGMVPAFRGDAVVFCARDRGCVCVYEDGVRIAGGGDRLASCATVAGDAIAYLVSDPLTPGDVFVLDADGERRLTSVNEELLSEVEIHVPEERTFTAPDGTDVHGWLIRGPSDGPAPLLVDVHGGPHNSWAPNLATNGRLYHQPLAAAGWCVLLLNPRGSDGYGEAFYRDAGWGERDAQDFLAAIDALIAEGVADPARLAVTGNSYGGYMTAWLTAHTDLFAAAVAAGAVTDLQSMYGTSDLGIFLRGELGADAFACRDAYARHSPLRWVEHVTTPTLILHGLADDRVPVGQAEEWFASLRMLGRTVEMVLYPDAPHLFPAEGRPSHRVDFARRLIDWVTRYTRA